MRSEVMTITPQQAEKWLEGNTHNRPLRNRDVARYAESMKDGKWAQNGESIIFDTNNKLLDGQHRLWAAVESNTNFTSIVVFGAPPESFTTIDQGLRRNNADHLSVSGVNGPPGSNSYVAAAAGLIIRYRNNQVFNTSVIDPNKIVELVKAEPALVEWAIKARQARNPLQGWTTPIAAVLHIGSNKKPEQAQTFLNKWVTGENLSAGSPILTLRQRVMSTTSTNIKTTRLKPWERLYMVASAWNAFAMERTLLRINTRPHGDGAFPKIVGS